MVKKTVRYIYLFLILIFLYAPILLLAVYSFNASSTIGLWSDKWTFDLYRQLFKNKDLLATIGNTLLLAVLSATIATVLGTMGAIGMYYSKKRTYKVLLP